MRLWALVVVPLFVQTVLALNCEDETLKKYQFSDLKESSIVFSRLRDTPPSKTNETLVLSLCDAQPRPIEPCPKDSQVCGLKEVLVLGQSPIVSEVIGISKDAKYTATELADRVQIKYEDVNWGTNRLAVTLDLLCVSGSDQDSYRVNLNETEFSVSWYSSSACLKSGSAPGTPAAPPGAAPPAKDDSWGWFTWLFILLVLGLGFYVIVGAWITLSNKPADLQDAIHDFKDVLRNLASSAPGFVSEIAGKIFGGSQNRGGYSAV